MKIIKSVIVIACLIMFSGSTIWGAINIPIPMSDNYTVASASISSSGNTIKVIGTIIGGYKYRTKAVCTAHAGNNKETVTRYSATIIL